MKRVFAALFGLFAAALVHAVNVHAAEDGERARIQRAVDAAIRPVMAKNDVPGMAVAVTVGGKPHVFNYGVASRESGKKVDDDTLFEIGSVSKTFTATLASYAETRGKLALSDKASAHLPALAHSSFDKISLLGLGEAESQPRVVGGDRVRERRGRAVMEIGRVLPQALERRRAVHLRGAPRRVARHTRGLRLAHHLVG